MFYLKKCQFPKCKRSGYLAMKDQDDFCNLHTNTRDEELKDIKKDDK